MEPLLVEMLFKNKVLKLSELAFKVNDLTGRVIVATFMSPLDCESLRITLPAVPITRLGETSDPFAELMSPVSLVRINVLEASIIKPLPSVTVPPLLAFSATVEAVRLPSMVIAPPAL